MNSWETLLVPAMHGWEIVTLLGWKALLLFLGWYHTVRDNIFLIIHTSTFESLDMLFEFRSFNVINTVKIRGSALGLSGFVSFFRWAYLGGLIQGEFIFMFYGHIWLSLLFRGLSAEGPICVCMGGGLGAITDFYSILRRKKWLWCYKIHTTFNFFTLLWKWGLLSFTPLSLFPSPFYIKVSLL